MAECMAGSHGLRAYILMHWQAGRQAESHWAWCELLKLQSPSPIVHLPQQGHTHFNKTAPPNLPKESTDLGLSTQTYEPIGAILIQTITTQFSPLFFYGKKEDATPGDPSRRVEEVTL